MILSFLLVGVFIRFGCGQFPPMKGDEYGNRCILNGGQFYKVHYKRWCDQAINHMKHCNKANLILTCICHPICHKKYLEILDSQSGSSETSSSSATPAPIEVTTTTTAALIESTTTKSGGNPTTTSGPPPGSGETAAKTTVTATGTTTTTTTPGSGPIKESNKIFLPSTTTTTTTTTTTAGVKPTVKTTTKPSGANGEHIPDEYNPEDYN